MDDIRKLFNTMTGSHLDPVEQDVRFSELTVEISQGRLMLYGEVWVDSYKVAAAKVLISVDGVMISGAVDDLHIGEEVCVKQARLELIIGDVSRPKEPTGIPSRPQGNDPNTGTEDTQTTPESRQGAKNEVVQQKATGSTKSAEQKGKKKGTPVAAIIRGEVDVHTDTFNLKFNVAAAISKTADGPLSYFVYGQLDCESLSIGKMVGDAMEDGHPMDLQLDRVTLVAASHDITNDYGLNTARFPIKEGNYVKLGPPLSTAGFVLIVDARCRNLPLRRAQVGSLCGRAVQGLDAGGQIYPSRWILAEGRAQHRYYPSRKYPGEWLVTSSPY
ncbi:hypothetical protein B0T26DRAFT_297119 [Lasiosphaeria miniovina]|uniref:Uncharacterized protein n=1 Tax=Lasiosphaeria miniovina TaxID=1954250 RepID=A0AA40AKC3_9PEZI|nr:uncharacterized protein B0T26DRAFT_297119 [Lasiosphaeria miniovina]KAK0717459.1 hypothetical protein B0T26DRAFT_297119 [Lasiosphaeria miniovina]